MKCMELKIKTTQEGIYLTVKKIRLKIDNDKNSIFLEIPKNRKLMAVYRYKNCLHLSLKEIKKKSKK